MNWDIEWKWDEDEDFGFEEFIGVVDDEPISSEFLDSHSSVG